MDVLRTWLVSILLFPTVPLTDELREAAEKGQPPCLRRQVLSRLARLSAAPLLGEFGPACPEPRRCGPPPTRIGVSPTPQSLVRDWARVLAAGEPHLNLAYQSPWEKGGQPAEQLAQFTNKLRERVTRADIRIEEMQNAQEELSAFSTNYVHFPADRETQAHCDYVCAHLSLRMALLYEHNAHVRLMCKELPELDVARHQGWQLTPVERFHDRDAEKAARTARKFFERLAKREAQTEWEKIARAELALLGGGFEWQPWDRQPVNRD